jgi:DNA-binding NtrC family response regulator
MGTILFFGPFHTELQKCFQVLGTRGAEVFWEKEEKSFIDLLKHRQPSVVITESGVHRTECRTLTDTILTHSPHSHVIMLTEEGICPQAHRLGPRLESVCKAHHTAQENLLLTAENLLFAEALSPSDLALGLFGRTSSPSMKHLESMVKKIADTDAMVLIRGESGVGKGLIASYIHTHSPRSEKPFIKINCAALPSELLESELFGFERGAFTGAQQAKPGKFECADGGTTLLDEIGELPLSMQAKLLHVLEDNHFSRLGASKDIRVDVRVLVSTNQELELAVNAGIFRKDLYY